MSENKTLTIIIELGDEDQRYLYNFPALINKVMELKDDKIAIATVIKQHIHKGKHDVYSKFKDYLKEDLSEFGKTVVDAKIKTHKAWMTKEKSETWCREFIKE